MSASVEEWAVRYIEKYGLALVPIPPGSKGPAYQGWNRPGGYVKDVCDVWERWDGIHDHGIGVVLAPSGLCSLDIDAPDHALPVLGDLGIDLGALREATPTIQGNPARYRLMFRAPLGVALGRKALAWPAERPGEKPLTLFELRAGDIQDVLPPTIHPGTGRAYIWLVPPNSEFPPLPQDLLELWQHWGSYVRELEAACPWAKHDFHPEPAPRGDGAKPDVIAAFNAAHPVEDLLEAHGYTRRGNRWMSPTTSSGLAGVTILDGGGVYSHHASDPLFDGHAHDAFDLFRILDHGGDTRAAVRAAAEALGLRSAASPKASTYDDLPPVEAYDEARWSPTGGNGKDAPGAHSTKATTASQIIVRAGELFRIVKDAIEALQNAAVPIYARGGALYRPVRNETPPKESDAVRRPIGALVLRPVDPIWVRLQLAAAAKWQKWDARDKEMRPADPPRDIGETIATQSDLANWPVLRGVVAHPVLTPEGRVISTPGYDRDTGLLIEITADWQIPEAPVRDDAIDAWGRLKELLRYFPWVSDVDRAVALSMLLTAVARPALPAAPMHCTDSPEAGTGKSLLVDVASILASGGAAPVMDYGRDAVEAGKRLDAMMLAGDSLIAIDNVEAPLEGAVLCQMLSQTVRRIRVMGGHTVVTVPCVQMVTASGCNLTLRGDIVRRVIICRLDAQTERPELRDFDQDLIAEASEYRRKLVADIIAIMLAYHRAGYPDIGVTPLGGYEPWSRMVRQALCWVGEADPCRSMERTRGDDPSRQNLALVLVTWHAAFGEVATTVAEAVTRADGDTALREALAAVCEKRGKLDNGALGLWLRDNKDKRAGRLVLRAGRPDGHKKTARWLVTAGYGGVRVECPNP